MKIIVSALVALSFLAGAVAPATAAEPFSIKMLDKDGRGGHSIWAANSRGGPPVCCRRQRRITC